VHQGEGHLKYTDTVDASLLTILLIPQKLEFIVEDKFIKIFLLLYIRKRNQHYILEEFFHNLKDWIQKL